MITEHDLQEAIAECQGQRNPNANTCIKLAALYIIRRELFGESERINAQPMPQYSYSPAPMLEVEDKSDFLTAVNGKNANDVLTVMDELMEAMQVLQPRIYDSVMRKVRNLDRP